MKGHFNRLPGVGYGTDNSYLGIDTSNASDFEIHIRTNCIVIDFIVKIIFFTLVIINKEYVRSRTSRASQCSAGCSSIALLVNKIETVSRKETLPDDESGNAFWERNLCVQTSLGNNLTESTHTNTPLKHIKLRDTIPYFCFYNIHCFSIFTTVIHLRNIPASQWAWWGSTWFSWEMGMEKLILCRSWRLEHPRSHPPSTAFFRQGQVTPF